MKQALERSLAKHGARPLRFALVGVVNTGIDVGVFAILFYGFGWALLLANAASFIIAVANSYALNKAWTFKDTSRGRAAVRRGLAFLAVAVVGLGLASVTIWLAALAVPAILAKLAAVGVSFAWNYWASARFVFR